MAAASTRVVQKFDEILECAICTDIYINPKVLPCQHAFCLGCLQKCVKESDASESCPLCRQQFAIPRGGVSKLPGNVFVDKLIEIRNLSSRRADDRGTLCDICSDDEDDGKKCATGQVSELPFNGRPSFCERHSDEPTKLFCNDCRRVICIACQFVGHQSHECSDIDTTAEKIRRKLTSVVANITSKYGLIRENANKIDQKLVKLHERVTNCEIKIKNRSMKVIRMVQCHTDSLLQELDALKDRHVNELELNNEEMRLQLLTFERFTRYSQALMSKATNSEIARAGDDLTSRGNDLLGENMSVTFISPDVNFLPSDIDAAFITDERNIIGTIICNNDCQNESTISAGKIAYYNGCLMRL